ncbi:MAG: OmpH family outer membrane protein [Zymomonas mobilis]|uniref:Periplasmic chaperone for outer membrane proteins Skp n=1 Tax=Zymomonas mobilis TaxID=542 RepID=A0A542W1R1_ZYMMB|nr:OmpH family outer membrane protein [Zymomonas mobilis]TQL17525.1 periplasmic chaperone for outer membrane proteins Skp [Zymomonas mobilis]
MKKLFAGAALIAAVTATPVLAQSAAVVDLQGVLTQSSALKQAQTQIQATYRTQIDAYNNRRVALETELSQMRDELMKLQKSGTSMALMQPKVNAFQAKQQAAQRELMTLGMPFIRPNTYAEEQVTDHMEESVRSVMTLRKVNLVLNPQSAILADPSADITSDVAADLNRRITTVSITPPANWVPASERQNAQNDAAAPAARSATPASNASVPPAARRPTSR